MILILKFLVPAVVICAVLPLALILSQWPGTLHPQGGLDFSQTLGRGAEPTWRETRVPMRDGFDLTVREAGTAQGPLIVMLHGSGWNGLQFAGLSRTLAPRAQILVPDLRGHGAEPGRRGDVDYIGQMEDDLADLIAAKAQPDQKVILLGHSSGGGLVVRFAGGVHRARIDGAVLLAPFLKHDAPTSRPDSGGWAKPLVRRLIGLSMINSVGIRALNGLTVMQFHMPQAVLDGPLGHLATTAYSYRLNTGYAPRAAYLDDIASLPPFLLVVGQADEAFVADAFEPTMSQVTDAGTYVIVPGVKHLDIVDASRTADAISDYLDGF